MGYFYPENEEFNEILGLEFWKNLEKKIYNGFKNPKHVLFLISLKKI